MSARPARLHSKITTPAALKRKLAAARRSGKKVVFTNGCFDLLHKGHVTYLEKARALGDLLVVALNDDATVRKLKGKGRPLNGLADRLEVMAALESVSFTTWFEEDTPYKLISALQPDVLVKGGDWKPSQIVGSDLVLARGGRVRSLPYVAGRSTTRLVEKARRGR